jgi:F0F1-type ATP synthase membrane subunit a
MKHNITENNNVETNTEVQHNWPHIPLIQWKQLGYGISTTTLTLILFTFFVVVISLIWNKLIKSDKNSKLKTGFLTFFKFFDEYLRDTFGNKSVARKYFPLVVWIFIIIFAWNLFWLAIDWVALAIPWLHITDYFRPIHSDLNTTLVLALITVVTFLAVGVKTHWATHTLKWYFFNYTWDTVWDKLVNVFVGWLHFIWVPATLASLSLRLFWNIFAWIVLISVITYLWATMTEWLLQSGRLLSVPFWFFEFFVAFVQSVVFGALIISYINQAKETH